MYVRNLRMRLLVVAATTMEIEPFLKSNSSVDVLVTGIGTPSTIYQLTTKLSEINYDLAIQAGIAGTFNEAFQKTEAMVVGEDTFADLGVSEKGYFKTLFELGFSKENDFPFESGWLKNKNKELADLALPVVKGVTVNRITDDTNQLLQLKEKFQPDVETMEGAAFHYVCLQQRINFLQLRTISNIVGERDKTKWEIEGAISSLNDRLKELVTYYT